MRNVSGKLLNSWYELLNGNLSGSVPVYIVSVPVDAPAKYVWLYVESEAQVEKNSSTWIKNVVLVCQVVTEYDTMIDTRDADAIDDEIGVLLANGPYHNHNLPAQTGMIITSVSDEDSRYLDEDDGVKKYYRKVTRYNHSITIQL